MNDSNWPSAATLLAPAPRAGRATVALFGISTHATSLSPRSATSTPRAIRAALEKFSTWSFSDQADLSDDVVLVDHGDVDDPDGEGGHARVAHALAASDSSDVLRVILGGDNAATWHALSALASDHLDHFGLITLDAHLDVRDGRSNGSPVRQLLDEGLDAHHVVQVGIGEFSNSPTYARAALERGVSVIERGAFHHEDAVTIARRALAIASDGGRKVYVDIDLDCADRSVVPACPAAVPGGLSADEVRQFVREVCASPSVVAIDFTEVDVARDSPDERTVRLVALLVLEALAGVRRRTT
jgi:formiminoglutamase